MKLTNIRKIIWSIITLVISSISIYYIIRYTQQKAFLEFCIQSCLKDIYDYITQEDSKNYYGEYKISIGGLENICLESSTYNMIIDKNYIIEYLKTLDWKEIISTNKENMALIKIHVRDNYITYITNDQINQMVEFLRNIDLYSLKKLIYNILKNYSANLNIDYFHKLVASSDRFILDFINSINWDTYIRTLECHKQEYTVLIKVFASKIENIRIPEDLHLLSLDELSYEFPNAINWFFNPILKSLIISCLYHLNKSPENNDIPSQNYDTVSTIKDYIINITSIAVFLKSCCKIDLFVYLLNHMSRPSSVKTIQGPSPYTVGKLFKSFLKTSWKFIKQYFTK